MKTIIKAAEKALEIGFWVVIFGSVALVGIAQTALVLKDLGF